MASAASLLTPGALVAIGVSHFAPGRVSDRIVGPRLDWRCDFSSRRPIWSGSFSNGAGSHTEAYTATSSARSIKARYPAFLADLSSLPRRVPPVHQPVGSEHPGLGPATRSSIVRNADCALKEPIAVEGGVRSRPARFDPPPQVDAVGVDPHRW